MTTDIKEKKEIENNETKELKKSRKSYKDAKNPIEKQVKPRLRKKLPTSTISFPDEEFRIEMTKTYTELGYTTLKSYLLALIKLSMQDNDLKFKLKKLA
ncbi:MAG: hypothetical protein RLZZ210_1241 [Pseudomonadota bacterium]|jgi:hypothetical protein